MLVPSRTLVLLLALSAAAVGSAASGQPVRPAAPEVEEAKRRFEQGVELFREESYEAALVEFRRAYELTGEYRVLYNIARVCYLLKDYVCSLQSFEAYLNRSGDALTAERRREVNDSLVKLRDRIGLLEVRTNVAGAEVSIDDTPRGRTPLEQPVLLSEGRHRVTVIREGKVPVTRAVDIVGGKTGTVALDLVDASTKQVIVPEQTPDAPPSRWTPLSYVGLGGAALFAGGAIGFGISALNHASTVRDARFVGDPPPDVSSAETQLKVERVVSDVLAAAAVVTLGITLSVTLLWSPAGGTSATGGGREESKATLVVRPTDLHIEGRF